MLQTPKPTAHDSQYDERRIERLTLVWVVSSSVVDTESVLDCYLASIRELDVDCEWVIVNRGLEASRFQAVVNEFRQAGLTVNALMLQSSSPYAVALSAAFQHATGDAIAILPEYLQVDPECLSLMLGELDRGADYVATFRSGRVDRKRDRLRSRWFNLLVRRVSGVPLTDINSGLRVLRRELAESVPMHGELHVYLPVLAANQGYRVREVAATHLEEKVGDARFRLCVRRILDLLTVFFLIRFTSKPFRFFGGMGATLFLVGAGINTVIAFQRLALDKSLADRPALVLGTLLIALGLQLFSLGLLGELIIFAQAGGLKEYKIQQVLDANSSDPSKSPTC